MAERTEGSIEIEATPGQIMEVIGEYEAYPKWAQGVKKTEITEKDSKGRASEVSFQVGQMGINADYTLKYRYKAKEAGLSWTTVKASGAVKDIRGEYELELAGEVTTVTYRMTLEPAINLGGFMKKQAERQIIKTALDGLKKEVESR